MNFEKFDSFHQQNIADRSTKNRMEKKSIEISRPVYTQQEFQDEFLQDDTEEQTIAQQTRTWLANNLQCTGSQLRDKALSFLPCIDVIRNYKWRQDILGDLVAGMCVAVIHIPQSMGFAIITSVPPVYGLYSSLFPVLLYFLFGTSRHISVGTMAIISIMIGAVVERQSADFVTQLPTNSSTQAEIDSERVNFHVDIATSVTLLIGLIQLAMFTLRLGILATFMSMSFIGGFMTGAAFHIATSQVPFMLGITIPRQLGIFRLLKNWYWICRTLPDTNMADLIISIICVVVLLGCKEIINDKLKHKLKIPIPAELLVVVVGTMVSYFAEMTRRYDVKIVQDIPLGLPKPRLPSLHNSSSYIMDAVAMAVVSYAVSMSLSKAMSHKHHYVIDQNQELLAHGVMHSVGACFASFGGAAAPPRTLVHDSSGGKTQLASLVSAAILLLVCLALGPLFEALPYSVLGSICTIAIVPLFKQFVELPTYWKLNRFDLAVWVLTFLAVIILDVDYGLYVGMTISLITIVIATHLGTGSRMVTATDTEIYIPCQLQKTTTKPAGDITHMVFKFNAPLCFANIESFKQQLYQQTVDPNDLQSKLVRDSEHDYNPDDHKAIDTLGNGNVGNGTKQSIDEGETINNVTVNPTNDVILDCSAMTYVDIMGMNTLKQVYVDYSEVDIPLVFAACHPVLLHKMSLNDKLKDAPVYPTVHDACV